MLHTCFQSPRLLRFQSRGFVFHSVAITTRVFWVMGINNFVPFEANYTSTTIDLRYFICIWKQKAVDHQFYISYFTAW
jgi:hypothetical protein